MPQKSSIEKALTEEQLTAFNRRVASGKLNVDELHELLLEWGFEISRSSTGRYKKKIDAVAESYRKSRQMADALTDQFGDDFTTSKQGEMLGGILRTLVFECMTAKMEEGTEVDPKNLAFLAKAIKDAASAMRLDQDFEANVRKTIATEERSKAANDAVETMTEAGLNPEQIKFWRQKFLGVKPADNEDDGK